MYKLINVGNIPGCSGFTSCFQKQKIVINNQSHQQVGTSSGINLMIRQLRWAPVAMVTLPPRTVQVFMLTCRFHGNLQKLELQIKKLETPLKGQLVSEMNRPIRGCRFCPAGSVNQPVSLRTPASLNLQKDTHLLPESSVRVCWSKMSFWAAGNVIQVQSFTWRDEKRLPARGQLIGDPVSTCPNRPRCSIFIKQ